MRLIKYKIWDNKENKWVIEPKVVFIHHKKSWGNEFYLEIDEDWESTEYDPTRYVFVEAAGIKDKNGDIDLYEGDIIDVDGNLKGNIYETDQGKTDLIIQGFGTKDWITTYQKAVDRGCKNSE